MKNRPPEPRGLVLGPKLLCRVCLDAMLGDFRRHLDAMQDDGGHNGFINSLQHRFALGAGIKRLARPPYSLENYSE
jgi:hypothetical protein